MEMWVRHVKTLHWCLVAVVWGSKPIIEEKVVLEYARGTTAAEPVALSTMFVDQGIGNGSVSVPDCQRPLQ